MLKPMKRKMTQKEKDNAIYAGPSRTDESFSKEFNRSFTRSMERQMRSPRSVGKLPTKKAQMLKTAADEPRELMKRKETTSAQKPNKPKKLKSLIGRAMDKANSKYKKVDKTGMSGRSVSKEKGLFTRTVDGRDEAVREKTKTVKRADGTVKKTVTKGKGVGGSVIGRYKDVKRYK